MAPKYKLFYFDVGGLAEVSRTLFALADVEYEDVRFDDDAWESTYKALSPTGKAPWLEVVDGDTRLVLAQSQAIAQYLATKFGYVGGSDEDVAKTLMYVELMKEYIFLPVLDFYDGSTHDVSHKRQLFKQYKADRLPEFLQSLEKQFKNDGGGDGWLVGNQMTWADVYLALWVDFLPGCLNLKPPMDDCPKLSALVTKVQALPRFAAWIERRPASTNSSWVTAL